MTAIVLLGFGAAMFYLGFLWGDDYGWEANERCQREIRERVATDAKAAHARVGRANTGMTWCHRCRKRVERATHECKQTA